MPPASALCVGKDTGSENINRLIAFNRRFREDAARKSSGDLGGCAFNRRPSADCPRDAAPFSNAYSRSDILKWLEEIQQKWSGLAVHLTEVAGGWRFPAAQSLNLT